MKGALSRLASGAFAGMAALVAQLLVQLLAVPILLREWSADTYGIWLATNSLVGLLITLDTGHQAFVGAQLLQSVRVDDHAARRTLQAALAGATGLAAAECLVVVGLWLAGGLDEAVSAPASRVPEVAPALALFLLPWLLFGSAGGILVRLYAPLGLYARATWIGLLHRTTAALAAPVVASMLGGGIVLAAAGVAVVNVLWSVVVIVDLLRFREFRPFYTGSFDRGELRKNLSGSALLTVASFIGQLQQHGLLMILGATAVGAESIAIFGTTRTLANLFIQGASVFVAPLAPDLVRAHVTRDARRTALLLLGLGGVGLAVVAAGLGATTPFVQLAYEAWTGRALDFEIGVFALLSATVVVRTTASPMWALLQGTNALGPQLALAMLQTMLTLVIGALATQADEIRGACLGILLGEVTTSWIALPVLLARTAPDLRAVATPAVIARVAVPSALAALTLAAAAFEVIPAIATTPLLLAAAAGASVAVWRTAPADVKERLLSRLPRRRP